MKNKVRDAVRIPIVFRLLSDRQKKHLANLMLKYQKRKPKIKKRTSSDLFIRLDDEKVFYLK